MKETIKKLLRENLLERTKISNLNKNIVLLSKSNNQHFLLFDTTNKKPIGYISFFLYPSINSYTVGGAYAEHGYGPLLYECAMTYVYPNGLSMSRDGSTSVDALEVWEKFDNRSDVKKERIDSDEITHKKQDLPSGGMYDNEPEKLERIFELEDTRFFYNFGKDKLTKLLDNGKQYMLKNNISDDDIEEMTYELE